MQSVEPIGVVMQAGKAAETIGVIIASHRRPADLLRCLDGFDRQTRIADDIIVVVRKDDYPTVETLRSRPQTPGCPLRVVFVSEPGLIAARNAGTDACITDVVAMIDDDAVPCPTWLHKILTHFQQNSSLGALGGRDRVPGSESQGRDIPEIVGRLSWFGRTTGNHKFGSGTARQVDFLKGVNMSYRIDVLKARRFNIQLRGTGAQPHEDLEYSLHVGRLGWTVLYDPQVLVEHAEREREEPRYYSGDMGLQDREGFKDTAFNEVLAIWNTLTPFGRIAFVAWSVLVGTRVTPGLIQALRFSRPLGLISWQRFMVAQMGKLEAISLVLFPNSVRPHHGPKGALARDGGCS